MELFDIILGGATDWTPEVTLRILVFMLFFEFIAALFGHLARLGRR